MEIHYETTNVRTPTPSRVHSFSAVDFVEPILIPPILELDDKRKHVYSEVNYKKLIRVPAPLSFRACVLCRNCVSYSHAQHKLFLLLAMDP